MLQVLLHCWGRVGAGLLPWRWCCCRLRLAEVSRRLQVVLLLLSLL